jgi:TRAP transporter TAXI family solute receptor
LRESADAATLKSMRRLVLIAVATLLALLALGLFALQWLAAPTTLRVAVGPIGSEDTRLVAAAMQYLARERESIRLRLVLTEGVGASAEAIDKEEADLAIIRTDVAMPSKAQTVAIMHRDAAVLITVPSSGITKLAGLWGRKVGVVRNAAANQRLLEAVLSQYQIAKEGVVAVPLGSAGEIEEALRTKRIDAVLAVGTVTGRTMTEAVAAVAQVGEGPPVFIPIGEADAIAQRSPVFEAMQIVRGAFGGTPPRPAETMDTVGVSHRLVARSIVDETVVSELTRLLFAMRPSLSTEVPLANRIEAPDTAKGSTLPVHAGASAYYEGEVRTFFERYGDWFYLIVMVLSVIGSAVAGLASAASGRSRTRTMALLDDMLGIVQMARRASSEAELQGLEREADQVLASALSKAARDGVDQTVMLAMFLGLDQARRAIHEQRLILETREGAGFAQPAE